MVYFSDTIPGKSQILIIMYHLEVTPEFYVLNAKNFISVVTDGQFKCNFFQVQKAIIKIVFSFKVKKKFLDLKYLRAEFACLLKLKLSNKEYS